MVGEERRTARISPRVREERPWRVPDFLSDPQTLDLDGWQPLQTELDVPRRDHVLVNT